ncbi:MAG: hypothetical protein J2P54_12215 [Bradyrhizobiaceae bacterium]|nr:hypothetical protein [Bradyrhizobiaceae bacterium]
MLSEHEEQAIRERALAGLFYLGASGPKGHEIAHWLEAEAQIKGYDNVRGFARSWADMLEAVTEFENARLCATKPIRQKARQGRVPDPV